MKILRKNHLAAMLGTSRATLYRTILKDPTLPPPRQITPTISGWLSPEIDAWLESRPVAGGGHRDGQK